MDFCVDHYLSWTFDIRSNNCWHLVAQAWEELTGKDLPDLTPEKVTPVLVKGSYDSSKATFSELTEPISPCIVYMSAKHKVPHVGLYYKGKVLHAAANGVQYTTLDWASRGFSQVRYYVPCQ